MNNIKLLSSTTKSLSVAMAKWDENIFGSSTVLPQLFVNPIDGTLRPVRINYFFKLSFIVSEQVSTLCLACVSWFQPHPCRFSIGKPAQVWCKGAFESEGLHSFLPLHSLSCRCIHTILQLGGEDCLVIVPLVESFNF